MRKKWLCLVLLCGTISIALASCADGRTRSSVDGNVPEAHLSMLETSITIEKGQSVMLVNDHFTDHVLANGVWKNGTVQQSRMSGEPKIKDLRIKRHSSVLIGPFSTAGTFQFYCPLHANMNVLIVVT